MPVPSSTAQRPSKTSETGATCGVAKESQEFSGMCGEASLVVVRPGATALDPTGLGPLLATGICKLEGCFRLSGGGFVTRG